MPSYRTKVGADGAVVIPPELRKALDIREGVDVEFFLTLEGDVFFHAITGSAKSWKGLFDVEVRNPPLSIREMDEGIAEAVAEKDKRVSRTSSSKRRPAAE